MQTKITYKEAISLLESQKIAPLEVERVFLHDALGRILSSNILAPNSMPPCALSNMDGYAISSKFSNIKEFKIIGDNPAGNDKSELPLESACCIKTFTGAPIPKNADILIPIEFVEVQEGSIKINTLPKVGEYIRQIGDNYQKGEILLKKGTKLNANHLGLLASLNCVFVEVFTKVKVGILVSGNELLEIGENATSQAQIYNANGHLLFAKIKEFGAEAKLYPILKDDKEAVQKCVNLALRQCDLIITSGGASVGDYDYIAALCKEKESEVVFKGVKIKPGQHIIYAHFNNKQFFALPGFPNSTLVTFELFAKRILAKMQGVDFAPIILNLPLLENVSKKDERLEFRVCNLYNKNGSFYVNFEGKKDFQSAILNNFCPIDSAICALCILDGAKNKGDIVEVMVL